MVPSRPPCLPLLIGESAARMEVELLSKVLKRLKWMHFASEGPKTGQNSAIQTFDMFEQRVFPFWESVLGVSRAKCLIIIISHPLGTPTARWPAVAVFMSLEALQTCQPWRTLRHLIH